MNPLALPKPSAPKFTEYGKKEIKIIADHFFQEMEKEDKEVNKRFPCIFISFLMILSIWIICCVLSMAPAAFGVVDLVTAALNNG